MAFTPEGERLVGDAAKNQAPLNPYNTIFDAKRLVGRHFSDAEVQADMKHFPFKVINKGGKPLIQVETKKEYWDNANGKNYNLLLGRGFIKTNRKQAGNKWQNFKL